MRHGQLLTVYIGSQVHTGRPSTLHRESESETSNVAGYFDLRGRSETCVVPWRQIRTKKKVVLPFKQTYRTDQYAAQRKGPEGSQPKRTEEDVFAEKREVQIVYPAIH